MREKKGIIEFEPFIIHGCGWAISYSDSYLTDFRIVVLTAYMAGPAPAVQCYGADTMQYIILVLDSIYMSFFWS